MARKEESERPWWLTWRGVPPGWREAAGRPLPERTVFWNRVVLAVWALVFLMAIAFSIVRRLWLLPIPLLATPLHVLLFWEPMHRRQVFGARRTNE